MPVTSHLAHSYYERAVGLGWKAGIDVDALGERERAGVAHRQTGGVIGQFSWSGRGCNQLAIQVGRRLMAA